MRHRGNVWVQYDLQTRAGMLNFSLLEHYHSALSYSAISTIDVRKGALNGPSNGVVNPGYATPPTNVTYYFSDRGAFRLDDISATDLGLNWYLRAIGGVCPFIESDLLNIFNRQGIEDPDFVNQTVLTRRKATFMDSGSGSRCLAVDTVTDTPQQGVNCRVGPTVGQRV